MDISLSRNQISVRSGKRTRSHVQLAGIQTVFSVDMRISASLSIGNACRMFRQKASYTAYAAMRKTKRLKEILYDEKEGILSFLSYFDANVLLCGM
jgi:hypothetical protein